MSRRSTPPSKSTTATTTATVLALDDININIDIEPGTAPLPSNPSTRDIPAVIPGPGPLDPAHRDPLHIHEPSPRSPPPHPFRHSLREKLSAALPRPLSLFAHSAATWLRGPVPPRKQSITPVCERWQTAPARVVGLMPRGVRRGLYVLCCVLWVVVFGVVLWEGSLPLDVGGLGPPVRLGCVAALWPSPQACGLDGGNCLPFSNAEVPFNCPANCAGVQVLNPRSIGGEVINYRNLVVGGGVSGEGEDDEPVYRGDSFICGAAIHAGVITDSAGGCGVVSLTGSSSRYASSTSNGITSLSFNATFPLSFTFARSAAISAAQCRDPRWNLLILSVLTTTLFSLVTTSPATFFFPVFTILFFQVALASDPPPYSTYASLFSTALANFLPALSTATLFFHLAVRKSLARCRAPLEKTLLWLPTAWTAALSNYTLDAIPLQRLTGHDLRQQPGAIPALVGIVLAILLLALYQLHGLRLEARLPQFLALYALLGSGLGVLAALPALHLRIHHYILALLLLPGTSTQTRASLLCQGLLVGLFVNGVARWGFASVVQTSAALRADAQLGGVVPALPDPVANASRIAFAWAAVAQGWAGVSVLVNDVERFRGVDAASGGGKDQSVFAWTREDARDAFFRFGFVRYAPFGGVVYSDFTRAGTWFANGSWSGIAEGRTGY
ncbi:hypothetical protein ACN47E_002457 [Coniothyrium glycines]